MTLRADDGTLLEPKEGVVLDKEGKTLLGNTEGFNNAGSYEENIGRTHRSMKAFKVSPWMIPLLAVGLVVAFALGTVVLGVVLSLLISIWLVRSIFRATGLIS